MDGYIPPISSNEPHERFRVFAFLGALLMMTGTATAQTVTFGNEAVGFTPKDFQYGMAGEGGPGRWEVVRDDTATRGKALAQLTRNPAAYRFLVAIYNPVVAGNVEVTTRCKPISGKTDQACGLIVRAADARNYYIARTNALEDNVRFYRVRNGQRQQLASAEGIKVASNEWHTLTLRAEGDRFTVLLNGKPLHTTTDNTATPRPAEGRVGFWTKADSVTRFDHLDIKTLP